MLWHIIRYLTTFVMPVFYKRIQGKNVKNVQVKGPVIIAMNHPNAFTDPIIFTYVTYPVRVRYLARGDAFKPGIASWFLEQLGIVPIFRIQDGGREGLKKNEEAYRRVNQLLKRNAKIIVFAEGLCVQERRLRTPLKKGVSRMVFGAYEYLNNSELTVIPVGVNYSKPDKFRSSLFYNIGDPVYVKDFEEEYKTNPTKAYNRFLQVLEPKMKELITHINNKAYDGVVLQVEDLCKKDWLKAQGLNHKNLEHDFIVTSQITEKVNSAEINNKEVLEEFKEKARDYFIDLRKNKLRDWLINPEQNKKVTALNLVFRIVLLLAGLPLFLIGLIGNYLPYKSTEKLTKRILKGNKEFYSSIAIGVGMVLLLINYSVWFIVVYFFSPNILWPILACFVMIMCGWFNLYFHFFILKTMGVYRALKYPETVKGLAEQRKQLLALINKF